MAWKVTVCRSWWALCLFGRWLLRVIEVYPLAVTGQTKVGSFRVG